MKKTFIVLSVAGLLALSQLSAMACGLNGGHDGDEKSEETKTEEKS